MNPSASTFFCFFNAASLFAPPLRLLPPAAAEDEVEAIGEAEVEAIGADSTSSSPVVVVLAEVRVTGVVVAGKAEEGADGSEGVAVIGSG
jgi:hypothetical protein